MVVVEEEVWVDVARLPALTRAGDTVEELHTLQTAVPHLMPLASWSRSDVSTFWTDWEKVAFRQKPTFPVTG